MSCVPCLRGSQGLLSIVCLAFLPKIVIPTHWAVLLFLHDVMMAAAPFWLDPSAEPVSHAIRESTALEVRDWVVWVEAQLYEVLAG